MTASGLSGHCRIGIVRVIKMCGTVDLKTNRLLLRRHQSEDAAVLFEVFGSDPQMFEYDKTHQTLSVIV